MAEELETMAAQLIALFREVSVNKRPITSQSAIWQDLRVAGDDLHEALIKVHNKFGTSFEGFDFDQYVPDEATVVWHLIRARLGLRDRFPVITIEHLAAVVLRGKWFAPNDTPQVF